MFGSSVIEVGLGLALLYFLLATITSAVNEAIVGLLRTRSDYLRRGITDLLGDPKLATQVLDSPLIKALWSSAKRSPSYIPANLFATALMDVAGGLPKIPGGAVQPIRHRALATLAATTDGTPAAIQAAIEQWFDAAMARVSGAYKRRIQWYLLAIAVVLTALIGVDSVTIANTLWHEQAVSAGAAAAAGTASSGLSLQQAIDLLSKLGLPLGWGQFPAGAQEWTIKVIGLAITALAASLGAPFWFDVLKLVTNVRSSGPVPAPGGTSTGGS